jgi:predicted glycosyltransferase
MKLENVVLFNTFLIDFCGSLGLGHTSRDLAIVRELRKYRNDLDIYWMDVEPARSVIA